MNRFGLTAVLLFTLLSCSVKEDRSLCSCRLTVDLSSCTGAGDLIRIRVLTADEIIERDFIPGEDSPYYEIPVSKGSCSLEAFLCPQGLQAGSGGISVAPGESCPELYAFCSSFQAAGETAGQKVELHKQFSQITLVLEDSPWDNPGCVFEVTAPSAGISLPEMDAAGGGFRFQVPYSGPGQRLFRLPRQKAGDAERILLELTAPDGYHQTIELGRMLLEAGFDWNAQDLSDATLSIRGGEVSLEITGADWEIHNISPVEI